VDVAKTSRRILEDQMLTSSLTLASSLKTTSANDNSSYQALMKIALTKMTPDDSLRAQAEAEA